nr:hypothetical protein [uncultured Pedobacter sp.]
MKNNDNYLPLFFLCWAFLYTPLALPGVLPIGCNRQDVAVAPKPGSGQVLRRAAKEQISNFDCLFSVYDPLPGIWECGEDHIVPFCLTDTPPWYGTK